MSMHVKEGMFIKRLISFMMLSLSIFTSAGLFGQTLRVAYKENPPFYQFTDENGESQGLNVEIIKAIAQNSGDVLIFFPKERLSECLELLESGKVDIVLGVSSAANGDFSATMETSTSTLSVMADKEFAKLYASKLVKDYTVSFEYNTANTAIIPSFLASEYYVTGNQLELLKNNLIGRGDVMICDKECMLYILRQQGIEDNYTNIQNNIGVIGYTMIVKPGNTTLLRSLNEGIMGLRVDGTYEKIISSWVIEEDNLSQKWLIIIEIVFITLAFFVLGVAIYVYVSTGIRKYLRREVALKTVELDKQVFQLEKEKGLRDGMIQRSPLGMALLDTNGHVMSINPSACRLTGLKSVDVKTSIRTMPLFGEIFATHDTMKYPIEDETIRIMGKDNLVRSYRYSIRRIVEGDTQSDILMTLEDITVDEEKKLATIEREKNRILNQMMAGIAHEVKNPLTGIRNFAQLIPTCYTDPDFMENFTKLVPQEVDRISRLIESLMHFARPPVCNPVPLDITTVVQECSFLAQITVKGYPIEIKTSCDTPAFVFVDHDQMKQAFINIILNSISSMKRRLSRQTPTTDEYNLNTKVYQNEDSIDNLRLEISVHNEDSHVKVVIRDQGEGMSKEVLRQCTDPFYTTKSLGTGLGLALSKQFIRENKGNLIMDSTPGIGTTASIILGKYAAAEET